MRQHTTTATLYRTLNGYSYRAVRTDGGVTDRTITHASYKRTLALMLRWKAQKRADCESSYSAQIIRVMVRR